MAPRIANLPEWRAHLLARLYRQAQATGDTRLAQLHDELKAYPGGQSQGAPTATMSWSRSATTATKATKTTKASSPSSASPRSSAPRWTHRRGTSDLVGLPRRRENRRRPHTVHLLTAEDTDAIAAEAPTPPRREGQAPRPRGTGGARPRCPFRPGIVMSGGRAFNPARSGQLTAPGPQRDGQGITVGASTTRRSWLTSTSS